MIKILSFNIRYGTADDGENSWPYRKEMVIERIMAHNPDLLGLQECRENEQADYVRAQLPDYVFYGVRRGGCGEPSLEMAPILYKRSSFEELERGCFWLSETPDVPASQSWGSTFPRTAMWVRLKQKEDNGQELIFFNTHLDYASEAPYESARLLRRHVEDLNREMPIILCGDFNTVKDVPAYQALIEGDLSGKGLLRDTFREANGNRGCEGTFHDFGREKHPRAIDWILSSPHFLTLEAEVDHIRRGRCYPSDHYPIWAVVKFK